jgi:hypothetical protein
MPLTDLKTVTRKGLWVQAPRPPQPETCILATPTVPALGERQPIVRVVVLATSRALMASILSLPLNNLKRVSTKMRSQSAWLPGEAYARHMVIHQPKYFS